MHNSIAHPTDPDPDMDEALRRVRQDGRGGAR
jgi:hypothetical protein